MTITRSYFEYLTALNSEFKRLGLAEIELKAIDEDLEDEDILEMVGVGLLPATVVDEPTAKLWAKIFSKLVVREDLIKDNLEFGWAVRTNSPLLLAAIGDFAQSHRVGTTFGNDLLRRCHAEKFVRMLPRRATEGGLKVSSRSLENTAPCTISTISGWQR